jgi:hypothetical protein
MSIVFTGRQSASRVFSAATEFHRRNRPSGARREPPNGIQVLRGCTDKVQIAAAPLHCYALAAPKMHTCAKNPITPVLAL